MRWKSLIPFVVAIALGLVAARVGKGLLRRPASAAEGHRGEHVVVASRDIKPGVILDEGSLTMLDMPLEIIPHASLKSVSSAVGRVTTTTILKGQTIFEGLLAAPGSGSGLQALVPDGMRGVTVEVNEFSGMGGLIVPGCHVDVISTLQDEQTREVVSRTIVQSVKVIAVGPQMDTPKQTTDEFGGHTPPKSVTLLVTPPQAEAIDLASTKGRPRLVLRRGDDRAQIATLGVTIRELLSAASTNPESGRLGQLVGLLAGRLKTSDTQPLMLSAHAATQAPKPVPTRRIIQVIRGGQESTVVFQSDPNSGVVALESTAPQNAPDTSPNK